METTLLGVNGRSSFSDKNSFSLSFGKVASSILPFAVQCAGDGYPTRAETVMGSFPSTLWMTVTSRCVISDKCEVSPV